MSISGRLFIVDAADKATICCIMAFMAAVMEAVYCSIADVAVFFAVVVADVVGHADEADDDDPFDIAVTSYAPNSVPAGASSSSSVRGILADRDKTVVDPGVLLLTAEASPRVTVNPVNPSGSPHSSISPSRRA